MDLGLPGLDPVALPCAHDELRDHSLHRFGPPKGYISLQKGVYILNNFHLKNHPKNTAEFFERKTAETAETAKTADCRQSGCTAGGEGPATRTEVTGVGFETPTCAPGGGKQKA